MHRLAPLALVVLTGCAPASEASAVSFRVDERGAFVGVYAGTSAAGVEVELEWALTLANRGSAPCPVGLYRWTDALPEDAALPEPEPGQGWPATWDGGELVDSGVLEPGERLESGATLEPGEEVEALFGLAVCPDANLELDFGAELTADLGVRGISDALLLQVWRAD